jgi:hypothetical protein
MLNPKFHDGTRRLSYRKSFIHRGVQHVGLCVGGRFLGTADMKETDAEVVCRLFNESVVRRLAGRRKT